MAAPEYEAEDSDDVIAVLEREAELGLEISRAAFICCNKNQCRVLRDVFHELAQLSSRWRAFFGEEFRVHHRLQALAKELLKAAGSARRIVEQCREQWITAALFSLENELGFLEAFEDMARLTTAIYTRLQSTVQGPRQALVWEMRESYRIEGLMVRECLKRSCKLDRAEFLPSVVDPSKPTPLLGFFRKEVKQQTRRLELLKTRLTQRLDVSIDPGDLQPNERCIGAGSFGKVYRTTLLGIPVAIKEALRPEHEHAGEHHSLDKEARIMRELPYHPNIVQSLGMTCSSATRAKGIVMELMESNLKEFLRKVEQGQERLSLLEAVNMMLQIAKPMDFLHKHQVCYRDLKPGNILVKDGKLKLADFGHSRANFNSFEEYTGRAGTVRYMAPEVWYAGQVGKYTKKADVFSFGMCCSEILTNRPFLEELTSAPEWFRRLCDNNERPDLPDEVPNCLRQLIERCWHTEPTQRPNFEDIVVVLYQVQEEIITGAPPVENFTAFFETISSSSGDSSTDFSQSTQCSTAPMPTTPQLRGLKIEGETCVGCKLTASWTFETNATLSLVQWVRYCEEETVNVGTILQLKEPHCEYFVTPDDLNSYIGIICKPCASEGLRTGEASYCRSLTRASRSRECEEEFTRLLNEGLAEFTVKIDKQFLRGRFKLRLQDFQLWRTVNSIKNNRWKYGRARISLQQPQSDTLKCILDDGEGQQFALRFRNLLQRDLAVMLFRHYSAAVL